MHIVLKDIHKHYGRVKANNGVSVAFEPGRIHGILGENGAGKSTLMKILTGFVSKTSGTLLIDGNAVDLQTPAEAVHLGIGMLYQDPLDFPRLSVLENFMVGLPPRFLDQRQYYRQTLISQMQATGFALDPDAAVRRLTVGERQQLEILRLLASGIEVLILDEPTTGISSLQKEELFRALKKLALDGKTVILVSHKLEDVEILCDKVSVLRQGRITGEFDQPFEANDLLRVMFDQLPAPPIRPTIAPGETLLEFNDVSASGGRTGLQTCNITIRTGEVVGLAGLEGSGQGVFLRVAAGLKAPNAGTLRLGNKPMQGCDYHRFQSGGVTFMPASRLEEGLIAGLNISEHFALQRPHRGWWIDRNQAQQRADRGITRFKIKGRPQLPVEALSGGNQQRLLLSFLPADPVLLLLENPTRGLDLESAHWVWQHLHQYSRRQTSIIFSSSELDEILMVADRVLVFFNGHIIVDTPAETTTVHELGKAIAGKVDQSLSAA